MRLNDLYPQWAGPHNPDITMLVADSRAVKSGALFAAMPGNRVDGRDFIAMALHNGAAAILAPSGTPLPADAPDHVALIAVENPRLVLAQIAARFYKKQPATIAAVTGTNGKTSTAHFTQQLWRALGIKSASLGTLGIHGDGIARSGAMTTPEPITLHAELADLAAAGFDHVAMEASSHGLAQNRLDAVNVRAAGFTNLSRDHLDYHPTMDDYLAAKTHLFTHVLAEGGIAVLNADIPEFEKLRAASKSRIISYGTHGDLKLVSRTPLPGGQALVLEINNKRYELTLPLVGAFQVMNALCALGLVMAESPDDAERNNTLIAALANLSGAPGRLQLVPGHPHGAVYVDYAHTPDALDNVIDALRPHTSGRLICLIGCGGDRDPGKRPLMGNIAATKADLAIITDDNPRSEDAATIRAAMMAGIDEARRAHHATEIGGRRAAIQHGVQTMRNGDVFIIAGKGHEQGQIIGDKVEPFDDVAEARNAIAHL